jgi:hypothetical protein
LLLLLLLLNYFKQNLSKIAKNPEKGLNFQNPYGIRAISIRSTGNVSESLVKSEFWFVEQRWLGKTTLSTFVLR